MEDVDGTLAETLGRDRRFAAQAKSSACSSSSSSSSPGGERIENADMRAIRDWVTAKDGEQYDLLPEDVVAVEVTHENLNQRMLSLRFNLHTTIADLKARLYLHHGTPASSQRLVLRDGGADICALDDDSKMLGYYSVQSGMTIHVRDLDPHSISRGGALENVELVEKYVMSDETYDQRKGTLREYFREQRKVAKPVGDAAPTLDDAKHVVLGARCRVAPGARRGVVAFLGCVPDLQDGVWVGVCLDEPLGKNDGSIKGNRIFEAPPNHGTFVRPKNVEVGDFPEILDDDDEEEDDDDEEL
ncbi:hypothetical protein CTAYLR_002079 [Chrysophaeum taylorii]|uniref:Tubulin folding cofactor B n=1 Tax=Chrysophaeum taylorii TaxID=2483200 RepID=A0AAD7UP74_9STRA|nr:hypothetical protein CTAYLR_002079 [Chrysophaeum taylorii]